MGLQRVGHNCATKQQQQQTLYVCIYTLIYPHMYVYIPLYMCIYIPFCCIYLLHKIIVGCIVETCHFVPARI